MQIQYFQQARNDASGRSSADQGRPVDNNTPRLNKGGYVRSIFAVPGNETSLARKARLTGTAVLAGVTAGISLPVILLVFAAVAAPETSHAAITCSALPNLA